MTGDIAVVGLDCAFPGADGAEGYWDLLTRGTDVIRAVPEQRWDPREFTGGAGSTGSTSSAGADDPASGTAGASGLSRGGFLADADAFDNDFFAVTPRDAAAMDPQHRLLLQCAWRAAEDAGHVPLELSGRDVGVFIGAMTSEWGQVHLSDFGRVTSQLGVGSSTSMAANRISYHLGLHGPSMVVDTACSSALVAVHLACNALLAGECEQALAGGVNLALTPALGIAYAQLGVASAAGRCLPFGAEADGIVRSDGVGLVMLRRVEDALADGQQIYAVLRGTAVNQNGRGNGLTAPNRWSQQAVVAAAYRRAGVSPNQVRFLEAHGTGTALGDMIEVSALGDLHAVEREQPCAIGSVKGNLGHSEGAAGIAGLIKVALALRHRLVPASRFGTRENPQLRLRERGLTLLKTPLRLPPGEIVAGVSSFGIGGTNAHAVLASAPRARRTGTPGRVRGSTEQASVGVFTVTADTPEALRRNLLTQADALARRPRADAAGLCRTSNRVKTGLPCRSAVVARDTAELVAGLRAAAGTELAPGGFQPGGFQPGGAPTLAFLLDGDDAAHPGMTVRLYRESALYRRFLDEVDGVLHPHLGTSVRELLLSEDPRVTAPPLARATVFAVGWAMVRTLTELGLRPAVFLGHQAGEYAAMVLSGALSLPEAAALVAGAQAEDADAAFGTGPGLASGEGQRPFFSTGHPAAGGPEAALDALLDTAVPTHLVAVGPGTGLLDLLRRTGRLPHARLLYPAPTPHAGGWELAELLATAYQDGIDLSWERLYPEHSRSRERLAPYVFDTARRFWTSGPVGACRPSPPAEPTTVSYAATVPRAPTATGPAGEPSSDVDDPVRDAVIAAVVDVTDYSPEQVVYGARFYEDLGFDSVMLLNLKDALDAHLPQTSGVSMHQLLPELHSVEVLTAFLSEWISARGVPAADCGGRRPSTGERTVEGVRV